MLQARGGPDLAEEPLGADGRGQLRPQHLHRDSAIVLRVVREVDSRHAPRAQLPLDAVAVGQGGREAMKDGTVHLSTLVV